MKNVDYIAVGDSNMYGLFAGSIENRYVAQARGELSYTVLTGVGDRSADVLALINEVVAMNSKRVYLSIPSNDIAGDVSSSTY